MADLECWADDEYVDSMSSSGAGMCTYIYILYLSVRSSKEGSERIVSE
jgi:hypothetical protein